MSGRPLVAVFGSSTIREAGPEYREAEELGRRLAGAGADVITGGYGGAMAACSRGAHEAGAHVVGVTVELFESRGPVNRWVKERVHTSDLFERLRHIIGRADAFIAVSGSVGTHGGDPADLEPAHGDGRGRRRRSCCSARRGRAGSRPSASRASCCPSCSPTCSSRTRPRRPCGSRSTAPVPGSGLNPAVARGRAWSAEAALC